MLLDRELRYVAANPAYLKVTASRLEDLLGRNIFDAFPHDPTDPQNLNALMLRRSFERVIATGKADVLALIAYRVPIEIDGQPVLKERYWSATHTPLFDEAGKVAYVLQHTVDVTEVQELKRVVREAGLPADPSQIEAGVLTRARHVQETNSTLMAETGHLRRLFEQAPGFMCFLRGPEHRYEMANAAYIQLIGGRNVIGQSIQDATKAWGLIEAGLARHSFIAGDSFTLADIPWGVHAHRWFNMDFDRPSMPALRAWYDRLCARPAYHTHIASQPVV